MKRRCSLSRRLGRMGEGRTANTPTGLAPPGCRSECGRPGERDQTALPWVMADRRALTAPQFTTFHQAFR